jgi:transposase-like protein
MLTGSRESRGLEIAKSAIIRGNEDGSFSVPSQTFEGQFYTVRVIGNEWTYDCPDFLNRADRIDSCKHVLATRFWIASKVELEAKPKPRVFSEDATQCPQCGSIRVVKFGNYNGEQLYKCKDYRTKFREGLLKKTRYSPETIALTLDLYFSGTSFRKTARIISDHFGQTFGATIIYDWVQRFVPMISTYANSFAPKTSGVWHADELFVKMKDGDTRKSRMGKQTDKVAYLWNVMDRDTRFLLASKLSKYRDAVGGERAFKEAALVRPPFGDGLSISSSRVLSARRAVRNLQGGFQGQTPIIMTAGRFAHPLLGRGCPSHVGVASARPHLPRRSPWPWLLK